MTDTLDTCAAVSKRKLTDAQLDIASAGTLNVGHTIVSPCDAASGLPTGKRMHKPITGLVEAAL